VPTRPGPVLCLGSFDGVHLGHRAILDRARAIAERTGGPVAVLTYSPLPAQVIHPDFSYILTPLEEKTALLVELGVERVHVVRFDLGVRDTAPGRFIETEILPLHPSAVVAGHDHRFGRNGEGDVELLRRKLEPQGIGVVAVDEFVLFDAPVRSTRVREKLLLGHVTRAAELLGRPYRLEGPVVSGTRTGRQLGFPTINLLIEEREKLVPADGVYAVLVDIDSELYPGVLNIGHRPTFRGETRTIEAHLFDRELDRTPDRAAALFVERLRPERRFRSPEDLAHQIAADVGRARELLARQSLRAKP